MPHPPKTHSLTERFALLIQGVCDAVAARSARHWAATPLLVLLWGRLRRMSRRFAALAARFEAGRLAPPRHRPTPSRERPAVAPPDPPPSPQPRLPRDPGWLVAYMSEVGWAGSRLRHMLENDPELAALLAAAPQAGRILRPLWAMLSRDPLPARLVPTRLARPTSAPRPAPSDPDPGPAPPTRAPAADTPTASPGMAPPGFAPLANSA